MSVILRVDDFPGTKPEEFWKHNLDNFKRFDEVLEKNGIQEYVLGVIPKYTTEEHIKWLSENPRIEVALHGIEHDERFPNEFREFETEGDVFRKLVSAKEVLKQCNGYGDVYSYIPPHNVVDVKTCRALRQAGFNRLFCGPGTDDSVMLQATQGPMFLHVIYSRHPIWYGRTDEMLDRDRCAEKIEHESKYLRDRCVTLHWTWEWNIGLASLDRFMKELGHIFR